MKRMGLFATLGLFLFGCSQIYSPLNTSQLLSSNSSNPGLIDNFETGIGMPLGTNGTIGSSGLNDMGNLNQIYTDSIASDATDPGPSTMNAQDVPGNPLPGGTPGHAIRLYGTMQKNISFPNGGYPFALFQLTISQNGLNVNPLAPLSRVIFAYKASLGDVSQEHRCVILNAPIVNYNWYVVTFTPTDTNWHWATAYFPVPQNAGVVTNPTTLFKFATAFAPGAYFAPWSQVESYVTSVQFAPFSSASAAFNYDFTIDDVSFQ